MGYLELSPLVEHRTTPRITQLHHPTRGHHKIQTNPRQRANPRIRNGTKPSTLHLARNDESGALVRSVSVAGTVTQNGVVASAAAASYAAVTTTWDYPCFVDTGLEGLPVVLIPWEDVSYEWEEKAVYP